MNSWLIGQIINIFKSWKTSLSGIVAAICVLLAQLGVVTIPDDVQKAILVVAVFFIGIFSKDANIKGNAHNDFK